MSDVSYEIYVKQKGSDRWMLDSRYGTSDKQEAIEDAKDLARQSHIEAVRVLIPTIDRIFNEFSEALQHATTMEFHHTTAEHRNSRRLTA